MSRQTLRSTSFRLAALSLGLCLLAAAAGAEGREFNGTIVRAGEKAMRVENRMGDRMRFHKTKKTVVEGKPDWKALAQGDRVIVEYRAGEERNRATRVIVLHSGGE